MNLLLDPWVLVRDGATARRISLEDILCSDEEFELASRRDDLELATIQLLVSLAQTIAPPADALALRAAEKTPMDRGVYVAAATPFLPWFELEAAEQPFMQSRGVQAGSPTPIQKLFVGLPEGNNHAFFNEPGEISKACAGCVAVVLYNQAANVPSFGGGFKGSLRGGAPVTTLVKGPTLRQTIWRNVLTREAAKALHPDGRDEPNWVVRVAQGEKVSASEIGLVRGLFWQPMRIEVLWTDTQTRCDACGLSADRVAREVLTQKFTYELVGLWSHPHGPRKWALKGGAIETWYVSFTTQAPAWTHLTGFVAVTSDSKAGRQPAPVVTQYETVFAKAIDREGLSLLVGGYRNKQAAVLERRHELIDLSSGWSGHLDHVGELVGVATSIRDVLRSKVFGFQKEVGVEGLAQRAEEAFYRDTERVIHRSLRTADWDAADAMLAALTRELSQIAVETFEATTAPYQHAPKMLRALAIARRNLERGLATLSEKGAVA